MSAASKRRRRAAIIHDLARLSRNGWRDARPCDYLPLEKELAELNRKVAR